MRIEIKIQLKINSGPQINLASHDDLMIAKRAIFSSDAATNYHIKDGRYKRVKNKRERKKEALLALSTLINGS